MNKPNTIERGAAASAALLITLAVVWSMGSLGYPSPAAANPGIAAGTSTMHCRPG
jgi:hypothetical protein